MFQDFNWHVLPTRKSYPSCRTRPTCDFGRLGSPPALVLKQLISGQPLQHDESE